MVLLVLTLIQLWCHNAIADIMLGVNINEYGGPENLVLRNDIPKPTVESDHILIKVYATAINRADTLQRKGNIS